MSIKAIITGTTGMVGKGVLLECLEHPDVESILVINRSSISLDHIKLKEIIHKDFLDLNEIKEDLAGYNACFFCSGVSSVGLSKEDYEKLTYDLTLHFAETVKDQNPELKFCYVSGQGTNANSRTHWAQVKGKTENDLLHFGFKDAYMFRPGYIQPMKGIKSRTPLYNSMYVIFKPLYPVFKLLTPGSVTTSVNIGKAMINVVSKGSQKKVLENRDINELAEG